MVDKLASHAVVFAGAVLPYSKNTTAWVATEKSEYEIKLQIFGRNQNAKKVNEGFEPFERQSPSL